MGVKPPINALSMEEVFTVRDYLYSLSFLEVAQADRTVRRLVLRDAAAAAVGEARHRPRNEISHSNRSLYRRLYGCLNIVIPDSGCVEALVLRRGVRGAGEDDGGGGGVGGGDAACNTASDVKGEEAQEEESTEEDEHRERSGGIKGGWVRRRRYWWVDLRMCRWRRVCGGVCRGGKVVDVWQRGSSRSKGSVVAFRLHLGRRRRRREKFVEENRKS